MTLFADDYPAPVSSTFYLFEGGQGVAAYTRLFKALFLLISQPALVEAQEVVPPRPVRKRAERANISPLIRVIRLPRKVREEAGEHREVDWQSRWIVSGHWRQQPWGPARSRIRPVWIAPYVKGPEDKPLKTQAHRLFVADAPPHEGPLPPLE